MAHLRTEPRENQCGTDPHDCPSVPQEHTPHVSREAVLMLWGNISTAVRSINHRKG